MHLWSFSLMPRRALNFLLAIALALSFSSLSLQTSAQRSETSRHMTRAAARVPAPEDVLGFRPGDDRKLAAWASVVEYFKRLDAASDRVKFEELGKTTMGAPFVMATISAPENLARLGEFKEIQAKLADPRTLGANADRKAQQLIARGKTIVLITCGIHSDEVGSYLSSMLIAHRLASSDDAEILNILHNTIILLVPSLNPDGVDIVKDWYDRTLNTPYEGTDPPMLYNKYVGHDDNRDWYAFTQQETQLAVEKIHNVWHPQIVHDIHQMEENGARLFLPPYMQPVEPNVPKEIVEGYTELGHAMMNDMRAKGFKGITQDSIYDAWSPSRAYSHYHGGVRILSETASCKLATPVTVKFEDLRAGKNYDPRKVSPTFPELWTGGEWHLRDITNYMTTAAFSLLRHAAVNRERWLTRFYEIGKEAVRPRKKGEIYGFKIKISETADHLLDILERAGVQYGWLKGEGRVTINATQVFNTAETKYPGGTVFVPLAQPYGGFAKAILESQHYPNLRDANNQPIAPYDVTAHTMPLLMDVEVQPVLAPFSPSFIQKATIEHSIGDCMLDGRKSVALYKSHVPSMDEGWTKWLLDKQSCFEYEEIIDTDIRHSSFEQKYKRLYPPLKETKYKTIIIPDQSPRLILEGYRKGTMPDELTGGLGEAGVKALREFAEAGGTLIFLNRASDFAIEQFKLPVRDITAGLKRTEFYVPGSILRVELDTSHPITRGMPKESIAWAEESPVFELTNEKEAARVRVIARYPETGDPLLSGWLLGGERIKGKAALVEVTLGKGRIYLFGFRPQYRGQSLATYPLLFNAITQAHGN
jgi:hypothetical protein